MKRSASLVKINIRDRWDPLSEFRPSGLYQTMVSRLIPYTIAGFIYYQGEEDDHKPTTYYELLSALIKSMAQGLE